MRAWVRSLGIGGSIAVLIAACGSKGSGDDSGTNGGSSSTAGDTSAAGGTTATGGSSSASGSTSIAGTGGSSGPMITKSYSFDADAEGWDFLYGSSGPLPGDGGTAKIIMKSDPGMKVSWVPMGGDAASSPGAIEVDVPFVSAAQYVGIGLNVGLAVDGQPKLDLSNKVITANVKVLSQAGDPVDLTSNPDGAKLYAKSGSMYVYAAGAHVNTAVGMWTQLTLDVSDPSSVDMTNGDFDPSDIREIGIQLETSGTTTTAMAAVDLIDTVSY